MIQDLQLSLRSKDSELFVDESGIRPEIFTSHGAGALVKAIAALQNNINDLVNAIMELTI